MAPTVSVITPTYNRAHTLHRPRNSLNQQSDRLRIEWIIIDDGSTDGTHKLVENWQDISHFPIIYELVAHGGRNAAVNFAKKFISGDFAIVLDSDDCFNDHAFNLIRDKIDEYCTGSDATFAGLGFMCEDEHGNLLFPRTLSEPIRSSYLDGIFIHGLANQVKPGVGSEITYLWRREYYQQVSYPEIPPPDHIPEHFAHSRLSDFYQFVYVGDIIVRRFRHDGISRLTDNRPSPSSQALLFKCSQMEIQYHLGYFRHKPRYFCKQAINMSKFGYVCGIRLLDQYRSLTTTFSRILWALFLPIGLAKGFLRSLKSHNRFTS